jgi:hypothetical protein
MGSFSAPASYSILASNNVNGNLGWMSNSVTIIVRAPVNILTNPFPAVTATNSRAQFIVAVTGDQLNYQWYKDGTPLVDDSHITGSTSNTLVIWPATPADIGGYYCSITNPCSSSPTYTTTNSLTLDAPNNLVWYGNHFTTPPLGGAWDISTSLNWNNGAAVFNEGDNVTFDDSYSGSLYGAIIPLTGTLTPTLITYSTGQQLTFGGNGTIAGAGQLQMTGPGRLVISNTVGAGVFQANPYTGGTVINNGTVYVQAATALGTGPITLAGGGLETLGKLAFSNNVFVTANSTCQLDQSGNQSITFLSPLICNSGTTLLFTNSNPLTNSPNWVNLNGSFTNNLAIVLAVNSLATNAVQKLVSNNSTNNFQVYNGVISEASPGVGGFIKLGNGPAYLNAANTYTGVTSNSAGLLAGSGSINGPLVVTTVTSDVVPATLGAGSANAIGTFTVNNSITLLNGGNVLIRVDKSLAQSNDLISASGLITNSGSGTVTVANIGVTSIAPGDVFHIFSGAVANGNFLAVIGGDVGWQNNLAVDGSIQAVNAVADYPTNISYSVSGSTQTLSWPATHLGWILQSQTNSLKAGLGTNWYDIPFTAAHDNITFPSHTNAVVFYRLRHP